MSRKCKVCKAPAIYQNAQMAAFCSPEHGYELALKAIDRKRQADEKKAVEAIRERKAALNDTVGYWTKKAQGAFNAWIRWRDRDFPCISCGRLIGEQTYGGVWDAGHYRSVGAAPELRFDPLNCHKQCKSCNAGSGKYTRKAGTVSNAYRERLIVRIGLEEVEILEAPHEPKRYRVEDLKAIAKYYRQKLREEKASAG